MKLFNKATEIKNISKSPAIMRIFSNLVKNKLRNISSTLRELNSKLDVHPTAEDIALSRGNIKNDIYPNPGEKHTPEFLAQYNCKLAINTISEIIDKITSKQYDQCDSLFDSLERNISNLQKNYDKLEIKEDVNKTQKNYFKKFLSRVKVLLSNIKEKLKEYNSTEDNDSAPKISR